VHAANLTCDARRAKCLAPFSDVLGGQGMEIGRAFNPNSAEKESFFARSFFKAAATIRE
jgi:hypothetical protein